MGLLAKLIPVVLGGISLFHRIFRSIPVAGGLFDWHTRALASLCNLFSGRYAVKGVADVKAPEKPLKIYGFVGCPFCRKVDIMISLLGLDAVILSCPRTTLARYGASDNSRYRTEAIAIGGKAQFPLLVDDNAGIKLYESSEIMNYLIKQYGGEKGVQIPTNSRWAYAWGFGNILRNLVRPLPEDGMMKAPSKLPSKQLVLWGKEGSVDTMKARETLCCLELPYLYKTIPYGAVAKRKEFKKRFASELKKKWTLTEPCLLEDPNTGEIIVGGVNVSNYLKKSYQTGKTLSTSWLNYSTKGAQKGHMTI